MRVFSFAKAAVLLSSVAACADIHPLQENVTHISTANIVKQLRCEADFALQDEVIERLLRSADKLDFYYKSRGDDSPGEVTRRFARMLIDDRSFFERLKEEDIPFAFQKAFYREYVDSAFAIEFTLNVSEVNAASATLDPLGVFSKGSVTVPAAGSASFSRANIRNFVVSDTFDHLLKQRLKGDPDVKFGEIPCDRSALSANFVYPISGSIGIREVISTFIELNEDFLLEGSSNVPALAGPVARTPPLPSYASSSKKDRKVASAAEAKVVPVFADTLNFTTTLTGSVSPVVTLNPAAPLPASRGFRLASASLSGSETRTDNHQIILALSLAPRDCTNLSLSNPVFANQPLKSVLSKTTVDLCSAEARALSAIQTQRNNNFLNGVSVLAQ